MEAVGRWWNEASAGRLSPPPEDLIRELALIISERRPSNLIPALRTMAWIVSRLKSSTDEAPSLRLGENVIELLTAGLDFLFEDTSYEKILPRNSAEAPKKSYEIVEVRSLCVALARALEAAGYDDPTPVHRWIQIGDVDPLPNVRRAAVN